VNTFQRNRREGFTLIELLAAMAVLLVVVIFMGRIFRQVSAGFRTAVTTVERNSAVEVAMEQIVRDLEGLVIDSNVACYKVANVTDRSEGGNPNGLGFDELWFVTTTSEADTDFSYHFVHYGVRTNVTTNVGYRAKSFRLIRETWRMELLRESGIDALGKDTEWWAELEDGSPKGTFEVLLDNVVRFDIYVLGEDGELIGKDIGGKNAVFDSTREYPAPGAYKPGAYPAAIDIYLQATSYDVMRRAGRMMMLFEEGKVDATVDAKARSEMVRRSNVLVTRIRPLIARAQNLHPLPY